MLRLTDMLGGKLFEELDQENKTGKGKVPSRLSGEEKAALKKSVKEARRKRTLEARAHL